MLRVLRSIYKLALCTVGALYPHADATSPTQQAALLSSYVGAMLLVSLTSGLMLLALGILRFGGVLSNFLSKPMLIGFTSAAAIIIILNQACAYKYIFVGVFKYDYVTWLYIYIYIYTYIYVYYHEHLSCSICFSTAFLMTGEMSAIYDIRS